MLEEPQSSGAIMAAANRDGSRSAALDAAPVEGRRTGTTDEGDWAGVRPSSGAASTEYPAAPDSIASPSPSNIAAPKDERRKTPEILRTTIEEPSKNHRNITLASRLPHATCTPAAGWALAERAGVGRLVLVTPSIQPRRWAIFLFRCAPAIPLAFWRCLPRDLPCPSGPVLVQSDRSKGPLLYA